MSERKSYQRTVGLKVVSDHCSRVTVGTPVYLRHEPNNQYDENAIAVFTVYGQKFLGYIPREANQEMLDWMNGSHPYVVAEVSRVKYDDYWDEYATYVKIKFSKEFIAPPIQEPSLFFELGWFYAKLKKRVLNLLH